MSKAHYFNVVQTVEGGRPVVTVVPHQWVQGDFLRWPNKNAHQLSRDAASKPATSWTKIPCAVKRKYIPTYRAAEEEVDGLSGMSTEASDYAPRKKNKKSSSSQPSTKGYDFNHMVTQASASVTLSQPVLGTINVGRQTKGSAKGPNAKALPKIVASPVAGPSSIQEAQMPVVIAPMIVQPSLQPVIDEGPVQVLTLPLTIPTDSISPCAQSPATNIEQLINQADITILNQTDEMDMDNLPQNSPQFVLDRTIQVETLEMPIGDEFAEHVEDVERQDSDRIVQAISKKLTEEGDRVAKLIIGKMEASLVQTAAALKSEFDVKLEAVLRAQKHNQATASDPNFKFTPATKIAHIQQLEKDLADEAYQNKFITLMREAIGPNGDNCNGQNVAYALVDRIFCRNVMLECSWSGASKSNAPKYAIKECAQILDTFFKIVHCVNPSFSRQLMEYFFKQVLRNAKSRSQSKGLRQSTIHRRPKKKGKNTSQDVVGSFMEHNLEKQEPLDIDDSDYEAQRGSNEDADVNADADVEYDDDEADKENYEYGEADYE